jgi:hypothetical protein
VPDTHTGRRLALRCMSIRPVHSPMHVHSVRPLSGEMLAPPSAPGYTGIKVKIGVSYLARCLDRGATGP